MMPLPRPHWWDWAGWLAVGAVGALCWWGAVLLVTLTRAPLVHDLKLCTDSLVLTDGSGVTFNARKADVVRDTVRKPVADTIRRPRVRTGGRTP